MKVILSISGASSALVAVIGLFGPVFASAQTDPVADAPAPKIGDVWKYRTIDLWTGKESSWSSSEFVGLDAGRLVFRTTGSDYGDVRTQQFNTDFGPCRSMNGSNETVCGGALRFPMKVGNRSSFGKLPWRDGKGHDSEDCEVKSFENVKVPAGSYDAFRVECEGTWTRVFEGNYGGRVLETHWYAPAVNRVVKSTYTNYRASGGGIYTRSQTELTQFTAKQP